MLSEESSDSNMSSQYVMLVKISRSEDVLVYMVYFCLVLQYQENVDQMTF